MKRLLFLMALLCSIAIVSHAGMRSADTPYKGGIYNTTIGSTTATTLFTTANKGISRVYYDNRTGYTVYLTTWAYSVATDGAVASNGAAYPLLSSEDATKYPYHRDNTAYRFAISSDSVPSVSGMWISTDNDK